MAPYGIPRRSFSAKEEEPLPVNWRRGLFRVWLLFCAAWMMGWIIYLVMHGLHGGFKTTGDFLVIPVFLSGPPIALLLFRAAASRPCHSATRRAIQPSAKLAIRLASIMGDGSH